jgi:hypothetical protein
VGADTFAGCRGATHGEQAYRRGDLFEHRRRIMAAWSAFATGDK